MRFSLLALWLLLLLGCGSSGDGGSTESSMLDLSSSDETSSSMPAEDVNSILLSSLTFEDPVFAQCVMRTGVETVAELKILRCHYEVIVHAEEYENVYQKITSIKGLEQLTSLESLELTDIELIEIDLSRNQALKEVSMGESKASKINLNGLTNLETLTVGRVEIQALDLSQNPNLQELMLYSVPLSKIDLNHIQGLRKLHFHDTLISNIDFSGAPAVQELDISSSPIESLDPAQFKSLEAFIIGADDEIFKRMTRLNNDGKTILSTSSDVEIDKLKSLTIRGGEFESIDLSAAISLEAFHFHGSSIENFNLEPAPNLKALTLWADYFSEKPSALTINGGCILNNLSLNNFDIGELDLTSCKKLRNLELFDATNIDALDLRELDLLEALRLHGNNLSALSLPSGDSLKELSLTDYKLPRVSLTNSPALTDVHIELARPGDNQIELGDIRNIENLEIYGGTLTNTSPNNFTNLNSLRSYGSHLGDLDLSMSFALEELSIHNDNTGTLNTLLLPVNGELNQLTIYAPDLKSLYVGDLKKLKSVDLRLSTESNIDLSKAPSITLLALDGFSSIELPEMAPLRVLDIRNGAAISQLDLSGHLELEHLIVIDTDAGYIDLSKNHHMEYVVVENTALEQIVLPGQSASDELSVDIENTQDIEILNIASLTRLQLRAGPETHIDLSNAYRIKSLLVSNIGSVVLPPDNGLEVLSIYNIKSETMNISDYPMLEYLSLHNTGLQSVEINNDQLKQVVLSGLDMAQVTLGNLPYLKELSISDSGVTEVDLSGATNIDDLWLSGISIESEQLAGLTLLEHLTLKDFSVTSLTLPNAGQLKSVEIFGENLETLNVGDQPNLTSIIIGSQKLITNVDFSGLPSVEVLWLYNSSIQDLDLSGNDLLRDLRFIGHQLNSLNLSGLNNLENIQFFDGSIPCEHIIYDGELNLGCSRM